jgi:hypothetical protein
MLATVIPQCRVRSNRPFTKAQVGDRIENPKTERTSFKSISKIAGKTPEPRRNSAKAAGDNATPGVFVRTQAPDKPSNHKDDLESAMDDLNRDQEPPSSKFDLSGISKLRRRWSSHGQRGVSPGVTKGNYGSQPEKYWAACAQI